MIRTILAAVDGSDGSKRAAAVARELCQATGGRLVLLFCLEPPPAVAVGFVEAYALLERPPTDAELAGVRKMLETVVEGMPPDRVEKLVEFGPAAATILETAEKKKADLIVIGARGLGPMGRWVLGSVSDRIVHHAKVPVTVVH